MSSYFDTMAQCLHDPRKFMKLIRHQYLRYLEDINRQCLVKELDRFNPKLYEFQKKYTEEKIDEAKTVEDLATMLQNMHSFAHSIGEMQIRIKGGGIAGDNPLTPY